jgi:hypothetical protein
VRACVQAWACVRERVTRYVTGTSVFTADSTAPPSTIKQLGVTTPRTTRQPQARCVGGNDASTATPSPPTLLWAPAMARTSSTSSTLASERNFAIAIVPTSLISKTLITALALHYSLPSIPIMELVCFAYPFVSESATYACGTPLQRLRHVMTSSHSRTCSSTFYAAPFLGES